MTCQEIAEFLLAYLERELPEPQRDVFQAHLDECPACVTFLRTYESTIRLGKAACRDCPEATKAKVPDALIQAILAARTTGHEQPQNETSDDS